MAKKRRKPNKKKRNKRGSNPLVVGALGLAAIAACTAVFFLFQGLKAKRARLEYAQQWEAADQDYSRRALNPSMKRYQSIAQADVAATGIGSPDTVTRLATLMSNLCDALKSTDLQAIAKLVEDLRQMPEDLEFMPEDMSALSRDQRIDEVVRWAAEESNKAKAELDSQASIAPMKTLDAARSFVSSWDAQKIDQARAATATWLPHASALGIDSAALNRAIAASHTNDAFHVEMTSLVEACDKAIGTLDAQDLTAAMHQWEKIKHSPQAAEGLWDDYRTELREAMKQRIAADPVAADAKSQIPGVRLPQGPVRYDLNEIVVLPTSSGSGQTDLTFVQAHEFCYALDSDTGQAQWVIDSGYDASWLPELADYDEQRYVICAWRQQRQDVVSVLDPTDATHHWSLALAPTAQLAGPPKAFRSNLYLLLKQGELWTVDLASGKQLSKLTFPEQTSSPLALREDGKGAMVIGDKLGVYLVEFPGNPRISDVVFPPKSPNTLSSRGLWVPPFALIFQNELTDRCDMFVYRRGQDDYSLLQQSNLPGRLWDSPVVVGADFLVVTDAVHESIMHVDVEAPIDPVSVRFTDETACEFPLRPQFAGHHDAPFISMQRSKIACYWLDSLSNRAHVRPKVRWEHTFADPQTTPVQPLQIAHQQVIVAAQSPGNRNVKVRSLSIETGDEKWSVDLGGEITNVFHDAGNVILRTDGGQLVHLKMDAEGQWTRRILGIPRSNQQLDWIPQASVIVRSADSPPRLQAVDYTGEVVGQQAIAAFPAGPVSVKVGELAPVVDSGSEEKTPPNLEGAWCAYVDSKQRFQVVRVDRKSQDQTVLYHQLQDVPTEGWMRPLWLDQTAILAAHPAGVLLRVDLHRQGDVTYLKRVDRQQPLESPPVAAPLDTGGAIWVATESAQLHRLNRRSLSVENSIKLPSAASTELATFGDHLLVGLRDGQVAVVSTQPPGKLLTVNQISSHPLRLAGAISKGLLVVDVEGKVHLVSSDGKPIGRPIAAPPMAVPPVEIAGRIFIATSSGQWRGLGK